MFYTHSHRDARSYDDLYGTHAPTPTRTDTHTDIHMHADATEQVSGHSEGVACELQGCTISCRERKERMNVLHVGRGRALM